MGRFKRKREGQGRPGSRRLWLFCSALLLAGSLALASSPSLASSAKSRDVGATLAYLSAGYVLVQAELANAPAAGAAVQQLASRLGSECPGVLAGAPPEPPPGSSLARSVGERRREEEQLGELESELLRAVYLSADQASRQAVLAYTATVRSLHWTDPTIDGEVQADAREMEARMAEGIPEVCADMKAWVASGYVTLSAATKELRAQAERSGRIAAGPPLAQLLAPFEGHAEKALIDKTRQLVKRLDGAASTVEQSSEQLDRTLGIARPEREATFSHHPPGWVVVGKGSLAAGGRYEVFYVPPKATTRSSDEAGCTPPHPVNLDLISSKGGGIGGCFSPSDTSEPPYLNCTEGLWTIDLNTVAAARNVRLALANGRTITSPVAVVPEQLGGPFGLYYQVVRGSPLPVSLTELDAQGKTLRVVKLHPFKGCVKHLLKFLPGGPRTLVHEHVRGGPTFSIVGRAYRFIGRIHFSLKVEAAHEGGGGESPYGTRPNVFTWARWTGCLPHPYVIVYGVLKRTSDSVLARTKGALRALRRVAIPPRLHAGGVLVYLETSAAPRELVVRDARGHTVVTEKLGELGREAIERCQAEAEVMGAAVHAAR